MSIKTPAKSGQIPKRSRADTVGNPAGQSGETSTACRRCTEPDTSDQDKSKPDWIADDNSEDKYAVLQRAARVVLFINAVPTNKEITTFIHPIYNYYDNVKDEMMVYNIETNSWHQASNHTRNQKSLYKACAIKAVGNHFKQALITRPDLVNFSDAEL